MTSSCDIKQNYTARFSLEFIILRSQSRIVPCGQASVEGHLVIVVQIEENNVSFKIVIGSPPYSNIVGIPTLIRYCS